MGDGESGRDPAAGRDSMFLLAGLRGPDFGELQLRVRNVSSGGLMGEVTGPVAEGDRVEVELRNVGKVSAHVAWRNGDRIGLTFERAIDPVAVRRPVGARKSGEVTPKPGPLFKN